MNNPIDEAHQAERPASRNLREQAETRSQAIIDDIINGIAKGVLKVGDRLTDERSLCSRYGAGRHTVRKALDVLVTRGVVVRYVGRGSFIAAIPGSTKDLVPKQGQEWSLLELTETRLLLEPGIAALILERADPADFERLQECVESIEQATNWREFKESKYAFHRALAFATRNNFITHIFDLIIMSRRHAWEGRYSRRQDLGDARAACLEESRDILNALKAGSTDAAADAIHRSITRIMVMVSAL